MNIKLLFFIVASLVLSSCHVRYVYVYTDEPVDEVYVYDVSYVYASLWYDDFYWRYNTNYYYTFGLFYHTPRYSGYSYYHNYKPYYRHHRKPKFKRHWFDRRQHNIVKKHRSRRSTMDRPNIEYRKKSKLGLKYEQRVPTKFKNRRKLNRGTKSRDQKVTKQKRNTSKKRTITRQKQRNNSSKKSTRSSKHSKKVKRSTKKPKK